MMQGLLLVTPKAPTHPKPSKHHGQVKVARGGKRVVIVDPATTTTSTAPPPPATTTTHPDITSTNNNAVTLGKGRQRVILNMDDDLVTPPPTTHGAGGGGGGVGSSDDLLPLEIIIPPPLYPSNVIRKSSVEEKFATLAQALPHLAITSTEKETIIQTMKQLNCWSEDENDQVEETLAADTTLTSREVEEVVEEVEVEVEGQQGVVVAVAALAAEEGPDEQITSPSDRHEDSIMNKKQLDGIAINTNNSNNDNDNDNDNDRGSSSSSGGNRKSQGKDDILSLNRKTGSRPSVVEEAVAVLMALHRRRLAKQHEAAAAKTTTTTTTTTSTTTTQQEQKRGSGSGSGSGGNTTSSTSSSPLGSQREKGIGSRMISVVSSSSSSPVASSSLSLPSLSPKKIVAQRIAQNLVERCLRKMKDNIIDKLKKKQKRAIHYHKKQQRASYLIIQWWRRRRLHRYCLELQQHGRIKLIKDRQLEEEEENAFRLRIAERMIFEKETLQRLTDQKILQQQQLDGDHHHHYHGLKHGNSGSGSSRGSGSGNSGSGSGSGTIDTILFAQDEDHQRPDLAPFSTAIYNKIQKLHQNIPQSIYQIEEQLREIIAPKRRSMNHNQSSPFNRTRVNSSSSGSNMMMMMMTTTQPMRSQRGSMEVKSRSISEDIPYWEELANVTMTVAGLKEALIRSSATATATGGSGSGSGNKEGSISRGEKTPTTTTPTTTIKRSSAYCVLEKLCGLKEDDIKRYHQVHKSHRRKTTHTLDHANIFR